MIQGGELQTMRITHITVFGILLSLLVLTACQNRAGGVDGFDTVKPQTQYGVNPAEPDYSSSPAQINIQLGLAYLRDGNKELALSRLQKALAQDPNSPSAHNAIAILYETLGETQRADVHYQRAISLNPGDPKIQNNYGQFLCSQSEYQRAEKYFQKAASNPLYETAYLPLTNAGICALRMPDHEKAEQFFRSALELQPKYPPALAQMMKLSFEQGSALQARAYLQRYLEVAKHTPDTLWSCVQIERELGDRNAEANCALRLKARFPDSVQTKLLYDSEKQ